MRTNGVSKQYEGKYAKLIKYDLIKYVCIYVLSQTSGERKNKFNLVS